MAEFPKPGFAEVKSSAPAMSFGYQEGDGSKAEASDGFVAIDIGALSALSSINNDKDSTSSPRVSMAKNLSRKGSQRSGGGLEWKAAEGETANSSPGGPIGGEKPAAWVHVAGERESSGLLQAGTPTAAGGRNRRLGKRQTPWLDPRRVLVFFASLPYKPAGYLDDYISTVQHGNADTAVLHTLHGKDGWQRLQRPVM